MRFLTKVLLPTSIAILPSEPNFVFITVRAIVSFHFALREIDLGLALRLHPMCLHPASGKVPTRGRQQPAEHRASSLEAGQPGHYGEAHVSPGPRGFMEQTHVLHPEFQGKGSDHSAHRDRLLIRSESPTCGNSSLFEAVAEFCLIITYPSSLVLFLFVLFCAYFYICLYDKG